MPKFHPLKVKEIRQETPECVSVAFELPPELASEYRFVQGQYLTLRREMEGEELRRTYSICTGPDEGELRVAIKKIPGGRFSTFANEQLQAGDVLEVMTPMGRFTTPLDAQAQKHYVAVAAGSGITPVMSIIKAVLKAEPGSRFTLFYGNRTVESIIFREELEGLKNRFLERLSIYHVLSREHPGADLFYGRIDREKCAVFFSRLLDPLAIDDFFLCGPETMIHDVKAHLLQAGVEEQRIHSELFTTGTAAPARKRERKPEPGDPGTTVQITLDGERFQFRMKADESLLDAALKAGADLPYACKGGVCSTCRAKLLAGKVDMERNFALEPDEVEAGYILTCQAFPQADEIVVDFDA